MNQTLERLSKIKAPVCVTVILQTHKTHPENQQDSILLKNLITEAGRRLEKEYDQNIAKRYTEKLNKLAASIDHNYNDDGLLLFVNDEIEESLKVPVKPFSNRVILDDTFATRTIIRALEKDTAYYALILSRGKARLIEASSEDVVIEFSDRGFPVTDNELHPASRPEAGQASRITNLTMEFFNRIDKAMNAIRKDDPLPVVIYSEERNYHDFMKVADHPNTILGHVLLKNFDEKASNLIKEIWPHIKELTVAKNRARISELEQALNNGKFLGDINEIWNAVQEGRGKTMFVEEGYYQPVKKEDGILSPIEEVSDKDHVNDIVDDMIEQNLKYGGDVVFVAKNALENFNKMALVTRY